MKTLSRNLKKIKRGVQIAARNLYYFTILAILLIMINGGKMKDNKEFSLEDYRLIPQRGPGGVFVSISKWGMPGNKALLFSSAAGKKYTLKNGIIVSILYNERDFKIAIKFPIKGKGGFKISQSSSSKTPVLCCSSLMKRIPEKYHGKRYEIVLETLGDTEYLVIDLNREYGNDNADR